MTLPDRAIQDFKKLYKEKNGEDLSDDVAREAAERFVRNVEVVYKPIPKKRASEYNLKGLINKTLQDTNWRLVSGIVAYRLGLLFGRLKGYESEEDLIKLI